MLIPFFFIFILSFGMYSSTQPMEDAGKTGKTTPLAEEISNENTNPSYQNSSTFSNQTMYPDRNGEHDRSAGSSSFSPCPNDPCTCCLLGCCLANSMQSGGTGYTQIGGGNDSCDCNPDCNCGDCNDCGNCDCGDCGDCGDCTIL